LLDTKKAHLSGNESWGSRRARKSETVKLIIEPIIGAEGSRVKSYGKSPHGLHKNHGQEANHVIAPVEGTCHPFSPGNYNLEKAQTAIFGIKRASLFFVKYCFKYSCSQVRAMHPMVAITAETNRNNSWM
jgi:hypothetical protein